MGNDGVYSVGKELEKSHLKKQQAMCFMGHLRLGMSHESLVKSILWRTFQIPACASHVACFADQQSRVNHEQVAKTTYSKTLHQSLTHSPYIKSHKNIGKWLNKITIKFDT